MILCPVFMPIWVKHWPEWYGIVSAEIVFWDPGLTLYLLKIQNNSFFPSLTRDIQNLLMSALCPFMCAIIWNRVILSKTVSIIAAEETDLHLLQMIFKISLFRLFYRFSDTSSSWWWIKVVEPHGLRVCFCSWYRNRATLVSGCAWNTLHSVVSVQGRLGTG